MSTETVLPIYIIGDTPLAYFLAAKLSLEGEDVRLLGINQNSHSSDSFVIKDELLSQKSTLHFRIQSVMHENARMVLICSNPEKIKSDLIYFSRSKTENCPILSFCHTIDTDLISKMTNHPIISAYFDGWFKSNTDESLIYFGALQGITIGISSRHRYYNLIQETLDRTDITINFNNNHAQIFWNYFLLEAACSFFSLQNGPHLRDIAKKISLRQNLNTILDELLTLVPEKIEINKEQIINNIYSTPANYKYPVLTGTVLHKKAELSYLNDTIRNLPDYKNEKIPTINAIICQEMKKLLSSVEQ